MRYARLLMAGLVASLVGAGCAGGGGGGGGGTTVPPPPVSPPPPPPPAPPPPPGIPSASSAEYLRNWGVAGTKAIAAWSEGYTGTGITVAVIDSAFDPTHPELIGRLSPDSIDIISSRNQLSGDDQHGSEVASFIAGNYNDSQTVGVAYGATILAIRADSPGTGTFSDANLRNAINYAVAHDVDVINLSLGGDGQMSASFESALAAATSAGIIVVVSAGNDGISPGDLNPDYPAFYATNAGISHNLIIAAGGSNPDGSFNANSNPAGAAANFYIVAPGWGVRVPDFGPSGPVLGFQVCYPAQENTCEIQGTSYSAPHTAGAIALVKQAFPGLTPQQVVELLLSTADDMGAPGIDVVTGRGRLNIEAAFEPLGTIAAPLATGGSVSPGDWMGVVGSAFGDAFSNDTAWNVVGFDRLGRSFRMSLGPSWRAQSRGQDENAPRLWQSAETALGSARLSFAEPNAPDAALIIKDIPEEASFRMETRLGEDTSVAFSSNAPIALGIGPAHADTFLAFTGDARGAAITRYLPGGFSLSYIAQEGDARSGLGLAEVSRKATAASATYTHGALSFAATYGAMDEDGSGLGTSWGMQWGPNAQADTRFAGVAAAWRATSALEFGVQAERGETSMNGLPWLTPSSDFTTASAALGLRWNVLPSMLSDMRDLGGALTLSVAQPLRVEDGAFNALLPTSDAYGRKHLTYEERSIDAEPSGREIETTLGYNLWQANAMSALVELRHRSEPGHNAAADDVVSFRVGARKIF